LGWRSRSHPESEEEVQDGLRVLGKACQAETRENSANARVNRMRQVLVGREKRI
jgi:hypothetical protein